MTEVSPEAYLNLLQRKLTAMDAFECRSKLHMSYIKEDGEYNVAHSHWTMAPYVVRGQGSPMDVFQSHLTQFECKDKCRDMIIEAFHPKLDAKKDLYYEITVEDYWNTLQYRACELCQAKLHPLFVKALHSVCDYCLHEPTLVSKKHLLMACTEDHAKELCKSGHIQYQDWQRIDSE